MGAVAERLSDLVILTDDNPRGEEGEHIAQDILTGMRVPEAVQIERQRGRAIRQAVHSAGVGDIVLIAGKGHETRQRIGDLDYPFSDRVEVTRVLGEEWGARLGPLCAGAARTMDPVRVGNP
jgi:UDP-N-acetylmuramoyl-L-alanyl-D-glutamate--2,6-diaminopimelate ligase